MVTIIICMLTGAACGFLFRSHHFRHTQRIITLLIWLLLFLLGVSIGGNRTVFGSLASLGVDALVIGAAATVGSAAAAWALWKITGERKA